MWVAKIATLERKTLLQGSSHRRQNCALLARVVRAAGKGAADELAPSHSVYTYPKNPPNINVAWIPAAEAADINRPVVPERLV